MAMIGLARLRHRYTHMSGVFLVPAAIAASWLLLSVPTLLAPALSADLVHWGALFRVAFSPTASARAVGALAGIAVATILFDRLRRDLRDYPCDPARWRLQAVLGAVGSVVGVSPMLLGY